VRPQRTPFQVSLEGCSAPRANPDGHAGVCRSRDDDRGRAATARLIGIAERRHEELFLDGAVEAFAEAVGLRRTDFRSAMSDLADGEEQLKVVLEFPAIIDELSSDLGGVLLVERQHAHRRRAWAWPQLGRHRQARRGRGSVNRTKSVRN
jgi:hypothetical protein